MDSAELLGAAVRNNAMWCDAVCRSHGSPGTFDHHLWVSFDHDLELYPHVITLNPAADIRDLAAVTAARQCAVKDSFARIDLTPAGLDLLFEGEWILHAPALENPCDLGLRWSKVTGAHQLNAWEKAWAHEEPEDEAVFLPQLLHDARCTFLQAHRDGRVLAGAIAYTAADVIGISNLWGPAFPAPQLWASVVQATATTHPRLPIVSYAHGADLAAALRTGARTLGPLRVWIPERTQ
ncbi:hypothetical protein [Actinocorallia lasiicapitis]